MLAGEGLTYTDGSILPLVFYLTLFALILLLILNIVFLIIYVSWIRKDIGY